MSDQYLLPCPCGQQVRVSRAQAGQEVTCQCGKSLAVPTLRGLRELAPAAPEAPAQRTRSWSRLHGLLFASGLMAAVLGVLVAAHYGRMYYIMQYFTEDQTDEYIEHEALHIDSGTPEQLLSLWNQEKTHGLGTKGTPVWIAAQESAAAYRTRATIAGIVAVLGVGLAIGTVFVGRSSG